MQKGRLVYIEPNDIVKDHIKLFDSSHKNFTWNPEDLNLYVDLQVVCPSRDDCGEEPTISNGTYSNTYISLMEGTKIGRNGSLTTDFTNISYSEIEKNNVSSKEALGITSIDITFDAHFYPKVTINFTDVRAYSLFMPAEEEYKEGLKTQAYETFDEEGERKYNERGRAYTNFFNAVFHFPYPRFLLTVKGFYGTKVTFILAVETFRSALNSNTGNFDVSINFIGYMYGIYTDIPMNLLMVSPYTEHLNYGTEDTLIKNEYWTKNVSEGIFTTVEGQPLLTFLEFAKKYAIVLNNINEDNEFGEDFVEYNDSLKLLSNLEEIKQKLENLVINNFGYNSDGEKEYFHLINNVKTKKYVFFLFKFKNTTRENIFAHFNGNKAKELKDLINTTNTTYGTLLNNETINIPWLCKTDSSSEFSQCIIKGKLKDIIKINETEPKVQKNTLTNSTTVTLQIGTENYSYNVDEQDTEAIINCVSGYVSNSNNTIDDVYFCAINFHEEISKINKIKDRIEKLKNEKYGSAISDAENFISNQLGFTPSIQNVFRMVFAHLQCFFNSFLNETIYKIKDKKATRTIGSFHLEEWQTDIKYKSERNSVFAPPFFAYYIKDSEERKTLAYPGTSNIPAMQEMEEVKLVENYLKAAKSFAEEYSNTAREIELLSTPITTYNEESFIDDDFELPISYDNGFDAISFYDVFYGNRNPYSYLNKDSNTLLKDIIYMFCLRYYSLFLLEGNNGANKMLEKEYNNIKSVFPEINETFFENLPKEDINKKICEYSKNKITPLHNNSSGVLIDENVLKNVTIIQSFDTSHKFSEEERSNILKNELYPNTYHFFKGVHILNYLKYGEFKKISEKVSDTHKSVLFDNTLYILENKEASKHPIHKIYRGFQSGNTNTYLFSDKSVNDTMVKQIINEEDILDSSLPFILWGYKDNKGKIQYSNLLYDMNTDDNLKNLSNIAKAYFILSSLIVNIEDIRDSFESNGDNVDLYNERITLTRLIIPLYYGCLIYLFREKLLNDKDIIPGLITIKDDSFEIKDTILVNSNDWLFTNLNDNCYVFNKNYIENNKNNDYLCNLIKELIAVSSKHERVHLNTFDTLKNEQLKTLLKYMDNEDDVEEQFCELEKLFIEASEYGIIKEIINSSKAEYSECIKSNKLGIQYKADTNKNNIYYFNNNNGMYIYPLNGTTSKHIVHLMGDTVCMVSTMFKKSGTTYISSIPLNELYDKLTTLKKKIEKIEEIIINDGGNQSNIDIQRSLYYTLKNLYDKWICSYGNMERFMLSKPSQYKQSQKQRFGLVENNEQSINSVIKTSTKREIDSFLFVDSFYRDIGNTFICDPSSIIRLSQGAFDGTLNFSVYQFLHLLCQENKLLMRAIPVYNNFYTEEGLKEIFTPRDVFNINQAQENNFSSTYLIMYTHQPSSHLNNPNSEYHDDGIYIGNDIGRTIITTDSEKIFNSDGYVVPTFGVTYGMQNQSYFKGININMDNPITTDYSIANQLMISQTAASGGDLNLPMGIGQNIYSIYSNRSYNCTVEMMGCANIMPMMYFQLNNIPMFKGVYMIVSVKHSIRGGNMTTTFTGVRQTSVIYPFVNSSLILTLLTERLKGPVSVKQTNSKVSSKAQNYSYLVGDTTGGFESMNSSITIEKRSLLDLDWSQHLRGRFNKFPLHHVPGGRKPNKIILHYTAGTRAEPGQAYIYRESWHNSWHEDPKFEVSADFCVDKGTIVQFNPELAHFYSFSTRDDSKAITIEMCSTFNKSLNPNLVMKELQPNMPQWYFEQEVLYNTKLLIIELFKFYGKMDIITHYDVPRSDGSRKSCPGIIGWNSGQLFDKDKKPLGTRNNTKEFEKFKKEVYEMWNEINEK